VLDSLIEVPLTSCHNTLASAKIQTHTPQVHALSLRLWEKTVFRESKKLVGEKRLGGEKARCTMAIERETN